MVSTENHEGFHVVRLSSDDCSVAVVPELGAKIISLVNLRTHREWMWRPSGPLRLWKNLEGESFLNSTFVGADECLPTISPCFWGGRELPDHGEVWSVPWTLDAGALSEEIIHTTVALPRSPFFFARSITIDQNTVRLDYRLTNTGVKPEQWLWALHPLLRLEGEDRLELPAEVRQLRVSASRQPELPAGTLLDWPDSGEGINLQELQLAGKEAYLKCFAHSLRSGWARIVNHLTADSLAFRWDLAINPFLGLWLTDGGFKGWRHLAIEPTNIASDSLADARNGNAMPTLSPNTTVAWCVEIRLG